MKKIVWGWLSLFTLSLLSAPAAADAFDPIRLDKPEGSATLMIADGGLSIQSILMIQPPDPKPGEERGEWRFCYSTKDPVCNFADPNLDILATVVLPLCANASEENCIEGFSLTRDGKTYEATFLREASAGNRMAADPELGFFRGGTPLLFDVPGLVHGGGTTTYAVTATANRRFDHKTKRFITGNLSMDIVPFTIKSDPDYDLAGYGYGKNVGCLFIELAACAVREDFPADISATLSVRSPSDVSGWFFGRIKNPAVDIEKISSSNNRIRVQAEPAIVARFALVRSLSSITAADKKAMGNVGIGATLNGYYIATGAADETAFGFIDHFRKEVKDTASGVNSIWSIGTIDSPSVGCFADRSKVLGIVATNAMVFSGGPPRYEDGFLNYKVGGMHYLPGGRELVTGTYDLLIKSETARCLYGFSNAPVSATVAVIGSAGAEKVATTVVREEKGWLKLAAYGFTFSTKQVRVTLSQPQKITLKSFANRSSALTANHKDQIRKLASASRTNKLITCVGTYRDPSGLVIAQSRARAACNEVSAQIGRVKVVIKTQRVASVAQTNQVTVSSR